MHCNDAGQMIEIQWREMVHKFPNIALHEFVVMPNHIHGIIEILDINPVGANLCVRPDKNVIPSVGANLCVRPDISGVRPDKEAMPLNAGAHIGTNMGAHIGAPIHQMVQWFKTMTTNAYIRGVKMSDWKPFDGKLWQRNYYEHIIRDQRAYDKISQYITNNPAQWQTDGYFDE